jgi:putative DNA primase/helicase
MSAEPTLDLRCQRNGRNGKYTVTATMDGEVIHQDVIDPAKVADRKTFLDALCKNRPGIDRNAADRELQRIRLTLAQKPWPPTQLPAQADLPAEADHLDHDDPHRLALIFMQRYHHNDTYGLRYWNDGFWIWDGSAYRAASMREITAQLNMTIRAEFDRLYNAAMKVWTARRPGKDDKPPPSPRKVTRTIVADALQALQGLSLLTVAKCPTMPAWLDEDLEKLWPAAELLPAKNGLHHLPTLVAGKQGYSSIPPTPLFFSSSALDYDLDLTAPEPRLWLNFLNQLWPNDPQSIACLQQMFGYMLSPDTRHHKIFLIHDPPRAGKGTIERVLTAVVGPKNVAHPTLASLGTNFGLAPLVTASIAIINDARFTRRTDTSQVVERLLSISGEGAQTLDRKYCEAWSGNLPTRFIVLANETPCFPDSSLAMANRFIALRLTRSFLGKEDINLTDRLKSELQGILLWSIEGWHMLRTIGRFVQPESGLQLIEELENLSSSIACFVRDRCITGPEHNILVDRLHEAWSDYCTLINEKEIGNTSTLGRALRTVVPELETRPERGEKTSSEKNYIRRFYGIDLRPNL